MSGHSVSPLSVNRASARTRARNSKLTLKRHVRSVDFVRARRAFPCCFCPGNRVLSGQDLIRSFLRVVLPRRSSRRVREGRSVAEKRKTATN